MFSDTDGGAQVLHRTRQVLLDVDDLMPEEYACRAVFARVRDGDHDVLHADPWTCPENVGKYFNCCFLDSQSDSIRIFD